MADRNGDPTREDIVALAEKLYDRDVYGDRQAQLFALFVEVAAALEHEMALSVNPMRERKPGDARNLHEAMGMTPREAMLYDLVDNLECREGDRA